jgi:hypothetical protein
MVDWILDFSSGLNCALLGPEIFSAERGKEPI